MPLISRNEESTPICRCRVLYLGSAVPHVTKDGLQGIQEPLRELYPEQGALGARGIDSWLSVWSNGLLLENVDENYKKVTRFFPIDSLHYCAAVRYVLVPEKMSPSSSTQARFLPLDSPFARSPHPNHPPLFAAILRRTTGIKVLECHAFICKREMAANALVRCCFHAYADFSYAKQIENGGTGSQANGGSLYGTLCNGQQSSSNSIEKVEGWRRTQPATAGSTLTLNSAVPTPTENGLSAIELSNSVDDMSIYNGDENHKVWAGSTRDISDKEAALYGECGGSTMRSSRSSRPRQITNAVPPPPPPPVTKEEKPKKPKERSRRKKLSEGSRDDMYYMNGNLMPTMNGGMKSSSSVSGGTIMRGYPKMYPPPNSIYANGTMLRPAASMNGFHAIPGPPPPMMMVPTTLPHPPRRVSTGSYGRPGKHPILVPVPPHMLPPMMPMPPPHLGPHQQPIYIQTGRKLSKHQQHHPPMPVPATMEEPIYMPSARPMSPVASYQPGHFPHEAYLMQQYASMDTKTKKKKSKSKKDSLPNGKPAPAPARSMNDDDEELEEGDSAYNTGIYKRKGHLNERAFSYSIRQEHRSRSYGSLSNLKFAPTPVVPNGVNKEEIKKEREIMQMMQDLELSGDELERSEVPAAIYQQNKSKSTKVRR
ncbi:hypothetical protein V9T40_001557 [Parthenolecanium corni]|uniref:PID domain-containing protein n=1 Tax=Parthenolecanium corni TaxID=536013 RepID=A0AAN9Y5J7_9HEMI